MFYPITTMLAAVVNRALGDELTRFATRCVALRLGGRQLVWRIDARGRFTPAHPLVDADCTIDCRDGGVQVSGDGELLSALSALAREKDWLAAVSGLFGEALAPRVLHRLEMGCDALRRFADAQLATPAAAAAYGDAVGDLHNRVLRADRRAQTLLAADVGKAAGKGVGKNTKKER